MLLFLFFAFAVSSRVVMETSVARDVPRQYKHLGQSTVNKVRLTFVMHLRDSESIDRVLMERADPRSPKYGQWYKHHELARFHPLPKDIDALAHQLTAAGASVIHSSPNGHVLVDMPKSKAEKLLQCTFHAFENQDTHKVLHRALDGLYSLPASLAPSIAFVGGVRRLPVQMVGLRRKGKGKPSLAASKRLGLGIDPKLIRKRYGTEGVEGKAANNSQAVVSMISQFYSPSDLAEFHTLFDPSNAGREPIVHGPNNGGEPGVEANLDVQYLGAIGNKVKNFYDWSVPGSDPDPFLDLFQELANMSDIPYVFSISYGEPEIGNTADYLDRTSHEFALVGMRGSSILIASGDYGVTAQGDCPGNVFQPMWPVSSPYVTAVGGTKLGLLESGAERVWSGSAGGFSDHFPRPSYQASSVNTYLTKYSSDLPSSQYYNSSGRAFPDIAAFGDGYFVVYKKAPTPVSGTSCATPCSSGVFALLNDLQLQKGKPTLGFLNPWIYQNMAAFTDITEGSNEGCLGSSGFPAEPGYDAVTGCGSPSYVKMAAALP